MQNTTILVFRLSFLFVFSFTNNKHTNRKTSVWMTSALQLWPDLTDLQWPLICLPIGPLFCTPLFWKPLLCIDCSFALAAVLHTAVLKPLFWAPLFWRPLYCMYAHVSAPGNSGREGWRSGRIRTEHTKLGSLMWAYLQSIAERIEQSALIHFPRWQFWSVLYSIWPHRPSGVVWTEHQFW